MKPLLNSLYKFGGGGKERQEEEEEEKSSSWSSILPPPLPEDEQWEQDCGWPGEEETRTENSQLSLVFPYCSL